MGESIARFDGNEYFLSGGHFRSQIVKRQCLIRGGNEAHVVGLLIVDNQEQNLIECRRAKALLPLGVAHPISICKVDDKIVIDGGRRNAKYRATC